MNAWILDTLRKMTGAVRTRPLQVDLVAVVFR